MDHASDNPIPRRQHGLKLEGSAAAPRRPLSSTSSSTTSPQTTATSSSLPPSKLKPVVARRRREGRHGRVLSRYRYRDARQRLRERVQCFCANAGPLLLRHQSCVLRVLTNHQRRSDAPPTPRARAAWAPRSRGSYYRRRCPSSRPSRQSPGRRSSRARRWCPRRRRPDQHRRAPRPTPRPGRGS